MIRVRTLVSAGIGLAVLGCAATSVQTSGSAMTEPLCTPGAGKVAVLVVWQPKWRADQKEPPLREAAALRGIQEFFAQADCVGATDIRRLAGQPSDEPPSDTELLRLAAAASPAPDRILSIVVRELGPTLLVGFPVLIEGGTEVVIDVRVLEGRTSRSLADVRTHWRNGGTFVIKGVRSLDHDMRAALHSTLMPTEGAAARR
jgi:hypothetical protein